MGILVGTNTALLDDPSLTNRLWAGRNPTRLVVDMDLSLPKHLKIFNSDAPTIVLTPLNILSIMRMASFLVTRLKTM